MHFSPKFVLLHFIDLERVFPKKTGQGSILLHFIDLEGGVFKGTIPNLLGLVALVLLAISSSIGSSMSFTSCMSYEF